MPPDVITILVVEDEESFVDALTLSLQRDGFRVLVARDGLEALDVFKKESPDLVLLDVMLPKLSGIDVCRAIRVLGTTPVIMVTAKTSEIDAVVGLEVGVTTTSRSRSGSVSSSLASVPCCVEVRRRVPPIRRRRTPARTTMTITKRLPSAMSDSIRRAMRSRFAVSPWPFR